MPMPNRNVQGDYRYAYQGQEKDPETGMEAFELRLWDSRIGRWLTTDPYGEFHSPYLGMGNNPISNVDPDGGCVECIDWNAVGEAIDFAAFSGSDFSSMNLGGSFDTVDLGSVQNSSFGSHLNIPLTHGDESIYSMPDGFSRDFAEATLNLFGNRNVEGPMGTVSVNANGDVVAGPFQTGSGAMGLVGGQGAASSLNIIEKGTKAWKAAVNSLKTLKKSNVRVKNATDAKALLQEAFGNMNRVHRYKKLPQGASQVSKRYETHNLDKINKVREIQVGNNLNHIKYTNGKQSGHIFYD